VDEGKPLAPGGDTSLSFTNTEVPGLVEWKPWVWSARYCLPRHPIHAEPSFIDLNGNR